MLYVDNNPVKKKLVWKKRLQQVKQTSGCDIMLNSTELSKKDVHHIVLAKNCL